MKKIIIRGAENVEQAPNPMTMKKALLIEGGDDMVVSDGYHTIDELYEHRVVLFIALCRVYEGHVSPSKWNDSEGRHPLVWRSKKHSDDSSFDGWFIMGINVREGEQITYHLPMSKWDETYFAKTFDNAPKFDGHTAQDVLERLKNL